MTHSYKSLVVVLLSCFIILFMSSGHMNEGVAAFVDVFTIRIEKIRLIPVIPQQTMNLLAIGIIGLINIRSKESHFTIQ